MKDAYEDKQDIKKYSHSQTTTSNNFTSSTQLAKKKQRKKERRRNTGYKYRRICKTTTEHYIHYIIMIKNLIFINKRSQIRHRNYWNDLTKV